MATDNSGSAISRITKAKKKRPQHLEARSAAGFLAILALLTLIGWLYLIQVSQVTAAGYRLQELHEEKERLRRENALLRLQIAEMEKLDNLQARASALGFTTPPRIEYLAVANYPPPSPPETRSAATPVPPSSGNEEPEPASGPVHWWEEIKAQFAAWAGAH